MLLFLLPISLWALDPRKSISQYSAKNWARSAGLPADRISAIAQDRLGYLWLGAQNGLIRYDGQSFTTVPIDLPSARGTSVETLTTDANGRLWFSISQGGYGAFDGHKFIPFATPEWQAGFDATCLTIGQDGSFWAGTVGGWGRWFPEKPEQSIPMSRTQATSVISKEPSGRIWFGGPMTGLSYWENGVVSEFPDAELKSVNIHAITRDGSNDLWVGTNRGLYQYDADGHRKGRYFPESKAGVLLLDRNGVLWIGTGGDGLRRWREGVFSELKKVGGLGSDTVTALFEDTEGSLWIGTSEGVTQLSDVKFPIYSADEGLPAGSVVSLASSNAGGLWVAAESGAAYLGLDGTVKRVPAALLSNAYIRRIFEAKNGDLYVGDGARKLLLIRDGKIAATFLEEGWPEAFLEDGEGMIVGIGPGLFRIQDDRIQPYEFAAPVPGFNWINCLVRGSKGEIWAGTNNGLFRIEGRTVQHWGRAEGGLLSDRVQCIVPEADGRIWFGMETGLMTLKDGQLTQIGPRQGLADAHIYGIVPDDAGAFWLWSAMGPLRVQREQLVAFATGSVDRVECDTFAGQESIKVTSRTDQGYGGVRTADGRIWFATPRGVAMIDPKGYVTNQKAPPVQIERIELTDREVRDAARLELKHGERSIEFHYAALTYIAPEKVKVRYQLQGFDPTWIDGSNRRSASYNNLPFGEYVFRVEATNADGVINAEPVTVAVTIPPPFYAQLWFFSLIGLAIALAGYAGYQTKVRRMRRLQFKLQQENEALEQRVKLRTDELAKSVSLLQATLDSTEDGILATTGEGKVVTHNVQLERMWRVSAEALATKDAESLDRFFAQQAKDPVAFVARAAAIRASSKIDSYDLIELQDSRVFERYCRTQIANGQAVGVVMNYRDITERKRAEARLEDAHRQLLATSRQAGMAEVATSVLHNVGNVLNSVNVSATVVAEQVRDSKVRFVARVADLLQANAGNLADYLANDPKGQKIAPYLCTLSASLVEEQAAMSGELQHLVKNIEHIKEVVSRQQSMAKVSGVMETVSVHELVDDALRMNSTSLSRHDVQVVREYGDVPPVGIDRHKMMQILVNLVSNAKQACNESTASGKKIVVKIARVNDQLQIKVSDNGIGISAENLTRIFAHGFTTKKTGHGFGLHHAALAAKEMGGTLRAESGGIGQGSTFVLEIPAVVPVGQ